MSADTVTVDNCRTGNYMVQPKALVAAMEAVQNHDCG